MLLVRFQNMLKQRFIMVKSGPTVQRSQLSQTRCSRGRGKPRTTHTPRVTSYTPDGATSPHLIILSSYITQIQEERYFQFSFVCWGKETHVT